MSLVRPLRWIVACLVALGLASCPGFGDEDPSLTGDIPERPDFEQHVRPVLDTYCNGCHSSPSAGGAPSHFRLDVCEDDGFVSGAQSMAPRASSRAEARSMPPSRQALQPGEADIEVLRRWSAIGAPCVPLEAVATCAPTCAPTHELGAAN